ncbi:MAG TPA: S9 family peptidase [Longimicrobiales bacterium]
MRITRLPVLTFGLGLALTLLPAQLTAQRITVERIFGSGDFRLEGLVPRQWLRDGARYAIIERNARTGATDLWIEDARSGERTLLIDGATLVPPGAREPIAIEAFDFSADESKVLIYTNSQRVWRQNTKGTYYVFDVETRRLTPVSTRPGWQMFAKFSPDGTKVGFVRDNDLFVTDLATGEEMRLTTDGSETIINGTFDWVYEEELGLRDGWRWSPDGERIAFWRLDQSPVRTFYMIDDLDQYSEPIPLRYPKAGEANSIARIGVVSVEDGAVVWMDTGDDTSDYLARMEWAASSDELVIQRLNRHQNRIEVMLADAETGESRVVMSDTDEKWIDVDDDLTWVDGGERFIWSSERDGFNHLYLFGREGQLVRQLTEGEWDVTDFYGVDEEEGWVYFAAARPNPMERHLFRVPLDGGRIERVSEEPGTHRIDLSPDFSLYIDTYSRASVPPSARLHEVDGDAVRTLVDNARVAAELEEAGARAPEFFTFTTPDGVELNGWMIKPPAFDESRRYPVLMYVYGGPGSQTVTDAWGGSRYLWHQALAQRGFIVVSIDNRGTGARGSAFKKVTYLNLGEVESDDQIAGARYLASLPYVDPSRIGIWGWSYGGYMTALTMARGGDVFRAGISVAPVTDWHLYDTIYTERFMRTPQENPEGYRKSSPIAHVDGLSGRLLLIHGTGDDNVHFQNSVQLVNALQEAGKQFDFMLYPNKTHSISGGNTSLHLFTMMTEWLERNLKAPAATS